MSKFKVGDRVRRVRESTWPEDYGTAGKEYDVISVEDFSGNVVVISGKGAAAADAFELVPTQAAFKAGDRVRCVSVCGGSAFTVGETYTVRKVANGLVYVDEFEFQAMFSDRFEPVAVAPATATLTIESGKFYKTRDGRKVGPLERYAEFGEPGWQTVSRAGDFGGKLWIDDGRRYFQSDRGGPTDLIAEWVDETVVTHKFKVGDIVNNGHNNYTVGELVTKYGHPAVEYESGGWDFEKGIKLVSRAEPAAVASATTAPDLHLDLEFVPFPQVGDAVLIPGVISAINQSPRGTNYNIVFETQNRRMSLHFLEEDFILDEDGDDDGDCLCANDNGPDPADTAKAFDALGDWLRAVAVRRAA